MQKKLIYPETLSIEPANGDTPDDIKRDYDEARSIAQKSPRGAAALLRLCIQKLCADLAKTKKDLNNDIAFLVKDGLSPNIQQALDVLRVIGNHAVHPGQIDLKDDVETAQQLFTFFNLIVTQMIGFTDC